MISAIIVNHKTFDFLKPLINSLKKEKVEEIIIVDNSLDLEEKKKLQSLDALLFFLNENKGFGSALNFGARKAKGELLLFCNPDLYFKENSIEELKKGIKICDAAGPKFFWDIEEEFCLPYPYPVSLFPEFQSIFSPHLFQKKYLSYQLKIWKNKERFKIPLLSGTSFLIKRDVFEKLNGFDENFFLYFEENDFFKRFEKMGFLANFIPSSKVVHFYNLNKSDLHNEYFEKSKKIYEEKHFNPFLKKFLNFSRKIKKKKEKKFEEIKDEKFENFPIILSPHPTFIPSVYLTNPKNWQDLKPKLQTLLFINGYLAFLKDNSIQKSFYFKIK